MWGCLKFLGFRRNFELWRFSGICAVEVTVAALCLCASFEVRSQLLLKLNASSQLSSSQPATDHDFCCQSRLNTRSWKTRSNIKTKFHFPRASSKACKLRFVPSAAAWQWRVIQVLFKSGFSSGPTLDRDFPEQLGGRKIMRSKRHSEILSEPIVLPLMTELKAFHSVKDGVICDMTLRQSAIFTLSRHLLLVLRRTRLLVTCSSHVLHVTHSIDEFKKNWNKKLHSCCMRIIMLYPRRDYALKSFVFCHAQ